MQLRRLKVTASLFAALLLSAFATTLRAQQPPENVAVVSIAPIDRLLKDTSYLLRAANFPEMGGLVTIMSTQYTQGMDRSKPIGALVSMNGPEPSPILFLPMNDREAFFGGLAGLGIEPDDLGDGMFEMAVPNGQILYAKDNAGWMFIAQAESALAGLPADPSALLGKLPANYDLAVRLNASAIPDELKQQALDQIRIGYERSMAVQQGQTEEELAAAKEMGEASIAQFEKLFNETDQLIFGWNVSADEQRTYIDTGIKFNEGSELAEQIAAAAKTTSKYKEFALPGASAKFRFTSEIAESDREVTKNSFRNSVSQVESQLDSTDLPDEAKELIVDLISGLTAIIEKTIDEGKFDGAGSVSVADDTLRIMLGGDVADGNALAAEFKKAAAKLPDDPNVPKFEFDYETYNGVTLHRVSGPLNIADPAAKRVFGDQLVVIIGTGPKNYIVALDPSGDALVKAAIDKMATTAEVAASPFEGVVALADILRFAQSVSPNSILDNVVNTISEYAGKDKVQLNTDLIERGATYRLSIDEGVLRSVGAAAKGGGGNQAGF